MVLMASTVEAGEAIAALGGSDISIDTARAPGIAELPYRFDDSGSGGSPVVTHKAFAAGYVYAGAGVTARSHFSSPWFAEAGAQFGVVTSDEDTDAAFRASLAVGCSFDIGARASLGLAQAVSDGRMLSSATPRLHLDI